MLRICNVKDKFDTLFERLVRLKDKYTKEKALSELKGVYEACRSFLAWGVDDYEDYEDLKGDSVFNCFGVKCELLIDDYGQCYVLKINEKEFGLGTYNSNIASDIVTLAFDEYYNECYKKLENLF